MSSDEKTTISAYVDEDNAEWLEANDINKSQYINEILERKRLNSTKTQEEILEEQIAEKEQEREETKQKLRGLEQEIEDLESELEDYHEGRKSQRDNVIEQLGRAARLPAGERTLERLTQFSGKCGLMPEQFADLVEHVELHSLQPEYHYEDKENVERLVGLAGVTEENILPVELRDAAEESDDRDFFALQTLTEEQEELAREWLDEHL